MLDKTRLSAKMLECTLQAYSTQLHRVLVLCVPGLESFKLIKHILDAGKILVLFRQTLPFSQSQSRSITAS